MPDTVLDQAIDTLTAVCNPEDFDPQKDKATAYDAFKRLTTAGHALDVFAVEQGALSRGWSSRASKNLAAIAQAVADGKTLRSRERSVLPSGIVKQWEDQAARHQRDDHHR